MKIALIHNYYQERGGEDGVFASEASLLKAHHHSVTLYTAHNDQIKSMGPASLARSTIWNHRAAGELRRIFKDTKAEVAHFHNSFPLISPSGYYAARAEGLAVVQTLHNYRLLCAGATLFRRNNVCEDCLRKSVPWPAVLHMCYRQSRLASGAVAAMLTSHRALGTWQRMIDVYIALTDFAKSKFVEGGLPADRIVVKPNFVDPDPGVGRGAGGYALFVGRLSPEKGVSTLIDAWEHFNPGLPLKVAGDGPLRQQVTAAAGRSNTIEWLGKQTREGIFDLLKDAAFLIVPSLWYEGFPLVVIEGFATGLPIVASDLGGLPSIITDRTGRLFRPGNPEDLAKQVCWMKNHRAELERMRLEARAEYRAKYTSEKNYATLMNVYARAAATRQRDPWWLF